MIHIWLSAESIFRLKKIHFIQMDFIKQFKIKVIIFRNVF